MNVPPYLINHLHHASSTLCILKSDNPLLHSPTNTTIIPLDLGSLEDALGSCIKSRSSAMSTPPDWVRADDTPLSSSTQPTDDRRPDTVTSLSPGDFTRSPTTRSPTSIANETDQPPSSIRTSALTRPSPLFSFDRETRPSSPQRARAWGSSDAAAALGQGPILTSRTNSLALPSQQETAAETSRSASALLDLMAYQRTFDGAYKRTALAELS